MNMRSLRLRLLVFSVISTAMALTATSVVLVVIYARHIDRRVLGELQQRSLELIGAITLNANGSLALDHALSDPRYGLPYGGAYWQVTTGDRVLLRSRSLWDTALALGRLEADRSILTRQVGPGGDDVDVLTRTVSISGFTGGPVRVSVAFGRSDVQVQQQSFAFDTVVALSVLGAILVAGAWLQTLFGLKPLGGVRSRLADVHRGSAQHIEGPFPDEVEPLVRDLNTLLAAQRAQLVRAREQAGDLAHALKTPLTIIEGETVRLAQADRVASADLISAQVETMRSQVDRVLARARVRGLVSADAMSTSVRTTTERLLAVMARLPNGDTLTWHNVLENDLVIAMDPDDLGEVLGNLLDNARKSARTRVEIRAVEQDDALRITVADDGPGMTSPETDLLVGRGQTGSGAAAGTGLGLAIVSDLLCAYETRLDLHTDDHGLFCASFAVLNSRSQAQARMIER